VQVKSLSLIQNGIGTKFKVTFKKKRKGKETKEVRDSQTDRGKRKMHAILVYKKTPGEVGSKHIVRP